MVDAETPAKDVFRAGACRRVATSSSSASRRSRSRPRAGSSSGPERVYVELHAHSSYSFCDGASLPEEIAIRAAEYGYEAFALTDHDNVCGAMEFAQACARARGAADRRLRARRSPTRGASFHLTLLVESATGWHNLCRLLTEAHAQTRPHPDRDPLPPVLELDSLLERNEGLVCLSGCAGSGALAGSWERDERRRAEALGRRLAGAFGSERFRVELQRPLWRHDRARNRWLAAARRAARGRLRGDRQRPRPRPPAGRAPGRARRRAPAHDAGGVRARAARQRELGARPAGGDGGALRRAPGGGSRDRAAGRAPALRPRLGARLPLPRAPRTPTPTGRWRRSAAGGSSSATRARASAPRRRGGSTRSCG